MIRNEPKPEQIGERNGLKIRAKLKTNKPLKTKRNINKVSQKQRERNKNWSEVTNQKIIELGYRCQWCGGLGQRTGTMNFLSGHHIQKRRYHNDDISNVYICHWLTCHCFIEQNSIDVSVYKNKLEWENRYVKTK